MDISLFHMEQGSGFLLLLLHGNGEDHNYEYRPFTYYGDKNAENIIVAMGSVTETIKETINYLAKKGRSYGLVSVHLYRPFSEKYLLKVLPASVKRIAVLDRTKEPGALGKPLYLDVKAMFQDKKNSPLIVGGRPGSGPPRSCRPPWSSSCCRPGSVDWKSVV